MLLIAGHDKVSRAFDAGQGREITVKQDSHFPRSDPREPCRLVARGLVRISPLVKDVVPVTEAKRICDALRGRPGTLLGTVFEWQARSLSSRSSLEFPDLDVNALFAISAAGAATGARHSIPGSGRPGPGRHYVRLTRGPEGQ